MKTKDLLGGALLSAALFSGLLPLKAASVHFGAPQAITTSDPMLDQPGALVGAAQWSNLSTTYTVSTTSGSIPFAPGGTGGTGTGVAYVNPTSTNATGGLSGTTGNTALNSALTGFSFTTLGLPIIITVQGLTAGQIYSVQLFSTKSGSTSSAYFEDATGNVSATFSEGSNSYVMATFVADAATQNIIIHPATGSDSVVVNAVVVRHTVLAALTGSVMQFSLARTITTSDPMLDEAGATVGGAQWSNLGATYTVSTLNGSVSLAPGGTGGTGGTVAYVDQTSTSSTSGFTGTTGNASLNSALAGFAYTTVNTPLVITLKGLTVGLAYSVQLFSARSGSASNVFFLDPAGNVSQTFSEGANSNFLATFVASATTQQMRICPATAADSVYVNALVLRSTGLPQQTTWRGFDLEGPVATAFTSTNMQMAKSIFHANLVRYHINLGEAGDTNDINCEASFQNLIHSTNFAAGLDAAKSLGMAVVLCMPQTGTKYYNGALPSGPQLTNFWDYGTNSYLGTLTNDWVAIATVCTNRPSQQIWFDLLNEPSDPRDGLSFPHKWPAWAQAVIHAIRTVDTTHKIMIEPGPGLAQWAQAFPLLDDDKLIYSFHTYSPEQYAFQGISSTEPVPALDWPGTYALVPATAGNATWNLAQIQALVAPAVAFTARNPFIPIYVGEFSAARWAGHAAYYLQDSMTVFEQYGWDWTYHSFQESQVWNLQLNDIYTNITVPTTPSDRALVVGDFMTRNCEVLNVDFNSVTSGGTASPTQSGYLPFNVSDGGALHGPYAQTYTGLDPAYTQTGTVSVTLASGASAAGTGILLGRDRGTLSVNNGGYTYGSLFVNGPLYQDIVVAQGSSTTLWITVAGLKANTGYSAQFYVYDNNFTTSATATFTNQTGGASSPSGTVACNGSYPFTTSTTANTVFATTVSATSDASGNLVFKETLSGGSSSQAELSGLQILHQ